MREVRVSESSPIGSGAAAWGMLLVLGVCLAAGLAGCRSYGRYDQAEMLPQMREAVRSFKENLQRARAEQTLLDQAAPGDSALRTVAQEFGRVVDQHEQVLRQSRQTLDRYGDDVGSYRTMRRAYWAMLSRHEAVRTRYRSLIRAVRYPGVSQGMETRRGRPAGRSRRHRAAPDTLPRTRAENFTEGRYYVAPIFYSQLQNAGPQLTMRQALAERARRQSRAGGGGAVPQGAMEETMTR